MLLHETHHILMSFLAQETCEAHEDYWVFVDLGPLESFSSYF